MAGSVKTPDASMADFQVRREQSQRESDEMMERAQRVGAGNEYAQGIAANKPPKTQGRFETVRNER